MIDLCGRQDWDGPVKRTYRTAFATLPAVTDDTSASLGSLAEDRGVSSKQQPVAAYGAQSMDGPGQEQGQQG